MQPLNIRPATMTDLPLICAIERSAESAAHWSEAQYEKLLLNAILLVAEQRGEIAGFVSAKQVAGEAELENIAVAERWRRSGIADRLMKALIDHASAQGINRISLEVRDSNRPARRLYEKHGFFTAGRRPAYYQHPAEDAVIYELRVPSVGNQTSSNVASNP
jgi:ribosomal-protein-alanine N-acetyltransferase